MKTTITTNTASSTPEIFSLEIPEMTGSEKQIEWAQSIFVNVITGLCNMVSGKMQNANVKAQYDMILAKLSAQTIAKFWIDNRGLNFQSIYKSL
jgi:hypothetical protein